MVTAAAPAARWCCSRPHQLPEAVRGAGSRALRARRQRADRAHPHHGLADRLTPDLAQLTARSWRASATSPRHRPGLGDSVTVAGCRSGRGRGVARAGRPDVDRAIVIAPVFGVPQVWSPLTPGLTRFFLWIPNQFVCGRPAPREDPGHLTSTRDSPPTRSARSFASRRRSGRRAPRSTARRGDHGGDDRGRSRHQQPVGAQGRASVARPRLASRRRLPVPGVAQAGHDLIDPRQPISGSTSSIRARRAHALGGATSLSPARLTQNRSSDPN